MKLDIVSKKDDFLIVAKPSGLTVHRGDLTPKDEETLADFLLHEFPEIKNVGESHRPGIVHRLDKETSGIMVVARNEATYKNLVEQFKNREVKKEYLALV
ncbi:RluA family pseudouridine synthase, partial [Patescibacteria group bacterium]|nr:RluA family pseudouridine synthase [Patescibacteria group bacterium]